MLAENPGQRRATFHAARFIASFISRPLETGGFPGIFPCKGGNRPIQIYHCQSKAKSLNISYMNNISCINIHDSTNTPQMCYDNDKHMYYKHMRTPKYIYIRFNALLYGWLNEPRKCATTKMWVKGLTYIYTCTINTCEHIIMFKYVLLHYVVIFGECDDKLALIERTPQMCYDIYIHMHHKHMRTHVYV